MGKSSIERMEASWLWRKLAYFILKHIPVGRIPASVWDELEATHLAICGDMIVWRLELTLEKDMARVLAYCMLLPLFLIEAHARRIIF